MGFLDDALKGVHERLQRALQEVGEQLLEDAMKQLPFDVPLSPESAIFTPTGPVVDSPRMTVDESVLTLPESKGEK